MIWHQAIGKNFKIWQELFSNFLEKIDVIFLLKKDDISVISLIVNMIQMFFFHDSVF